MYHHKQTVPSGYQTNELISYEKKGSFLCLYARCCSYKVATSVLTLHNNYPVQSRILKTWLKDKVRTGYILRMISYFSDSRLLARARCTVFISAFVHGLSAGTFSSHCLPVSLFLSFSVQFQIANTSRRPLLAMLTWPLLTLALCFSKLILFIRAQSKMREPRCVIMLLAFQTLGTRDVCRSHT